MSGGLITACVIGGLISFIVGLAMIFSVLDIAKQSKEQRVLLEKILEELRKK